MRRKRKPSTPSYGKKPRAPRVLDGNHREKTNLARQINEETS